jgi:NADH:ubiquinone reductase (H+-translocating)
MSSLAHVVIVGGGFGGLAAARTLAGAPVRITLVDRHNYHLFQPLLYQVATASLSPGDIASPIRWVLRNQANVKVILAEARGIDTAGRRLLLDQGSAEPGNYRSPSDIERREIGEIAYDYLIITAGATHAYFGHPEWATLAPGLKTLDDALEIRRQVLLAFEAAEREPDQKAQERLLTFVIVGGGATGVELAGALAEIAQRSLKQDFRNIHPESARIVLVEGSPHLLGPFPERLREAARRSLMKLGVEVKTNCIVTAVEPEGVTWKTSAPGPDGPHDVQEKLAAETVLWAAGVAASPLVKSLDAPLDRSGRVIVDSTLSVPGHATIFVAGDVCAMQQDGKWLPGVAQVAKQGGEHAAKNVLRAIRGEPLQPFHYRDYGSMATIGRGSAVADIGPVQASGLFAWFIWLFIHVFWLIGFRNRAAVFSEWAWFYATSQRRIRLITGERLWPSS